MGYQLDQQLILIPAAWKQQCPGCSGLLSGGQSSKPRAGLARLGRVQMSGMQGRADRAPVQASRSQAASLPSPSHLALSGSRLLPGPSPRPVGSSRGRPPTPQHWPSQTCL